MEFKGQRPLSQTQRETLLSTMLSKAQELLLNPALSALNSSTTSTVFSISISERENVRSHDQKYPSTFGTPSPIYENIQILTENCVQSTPHSNFYRQSLQEIKCNVSVCERKPPKYQKTKNNTKEPAAPPQKYCSIPPLAQLLSGGVIVSKPALPLLERPLKQLNAGPSHQRHPRSRASSFSSRHPSSARD